MDYEAFLVALKIYFSVCVFVVGICIGSFLNVLIYRIPIGMDFKKGSSICTTCKHPLKWYDLFPLFSWLFLGGKCRYCKAKISPIYPIVESITGLMFVLSYGYACKFEFTLSLLGYCMISAALIVIFCIDWKHMFIPDSMWITILLGGIVIYIDEIIHGGFDKKALIGRLVGAVLVSGLFLAVEYLKPNSIGGGDIKLMAAAGFALGWKNVIIALFIGAFAGTFWLAVSHSIKKSDMKKQVPFGPHLAVGIFAALFFGNAMLNWYTGLWA